MGTQGRAAGQGADTVKIVTDSVACLPPDMVRAHGIHLIPVRISVTGRTYSDTGEELPPGLIDAFRVAPIDTTPWPPEHYARIYNTIAADHASIVHVVAFSRFTSTMSLAKEGAILAQERHPGLKIEIVDSRATGMAQGFVALTAARAAQTGATIETCCQAAREMADRVASIFALESLDHVARTGRVTRLAAWASSLLRVTPVVKLSQGREQPLFLARSRTRAIRRMVDLITAAPGEESAVHAAVMESDPSGDGDRLVRLLQQDTVLAECHLVQFTPVMRIVGGPGVLGVAYYTGD